MIELGIMLSQIVCHSIFCQHGLVFVCLSVKNAACVTIPRLFMYAKMVILLVSCFIVQIRLQEGVGHLACTVIPLHKAQHRIEGRKTEAAGDTGGQLLTNIPTWPVATTLGNLGC